MSKNQANSLAAMAEAEAEAWAKIAMAAVQLELKVMKDAWATKAEDRAKAWADAVDKAADRAAADARTRVWAEVAKMESSWEAWDRQGKGG